MPSSALRRAVLCLAVAAFPGLLASRGARAEEEPAAPPKDPFQEPPLSLCRAASFDMRLEASGLPAGWKLLEGDAAGPEGKALEAAIRALGAEKAVASAEIFHVDVRTVAADGGAKALCALIDLGEASSPFVEGLKALPAAKGATVREMGDPTRILVVAAPDGVREKVVAAQTAWAAKILAVRAFAAFQSNRVGVAVGLSRLVLGFEPKAAGARFVLGLHRREVALRKNPPENLDPAIEDLRASLSKDAVAPLAAAEASIARGNLGSALLNKGGPSAEARDVLKAAAAALTGVPRDQALGFRYDLACAHVRLKELEPAFEILTKVLTENGADPIAGISHWTEDADFEPLKADPRWAKLLEDFGG